MGSRASPKWTRRAATPAAFRRQLGGASKTQRARESGAQHGHRRPRASLAAESLESRNGAVTDRA
eukprot:8366925-Pyramimonas_sp.AAC.1